MRTSPHNLEAEEAVLGGVLLEPALLDDVRELVETAAFYHEGHRLIFATMLELHDRREPVTDRLIPRGKAHQVSRSGQIAPWFHC